MNGFGSQISGLTAVRLEKRTTNRDRNRQWEIRGETSPAGHDLAIHKECLRRAASATKAIPARGSMPLRLVSNKPQGNDFSKPPTHQADTAKLFLSPVQSIRVQSIRMS
ncbi:MAG TPA: hypothetical protein VJS85_10670 [Rhizomicrobium sp.]|nr:hypothetical protein [Rhizomicrobium sp.]